MNFAILVLAGLIIYCLDMTFRRGYTPSATGLDFTLFAVTVALIGCVIVQAFKSK